MELSTLRNGKQRHLKHIVEGNRDLVASVKNTFGDTNSTDVISKYEYVNDSLARRTSVVRTGAAFASSHHDVWQYNDRNELTQSDQFTGTTLGQGGELNDQDRAFSYDSIGNRLSSKIGDNDDPNVPVSSYSSNSLNQYYDVAQYSPFVKKKISHDVDGNLSLTYAVGDIDGDGDVDITDLTTLTSHFGDTCPGTSPGTTLTAAQFVRADYDGDCLLTTMGDFPALLGSYGSTQIASYAGYTWDGENRLTRVEPLARDASSGAIDASLRKVEFAYDYRGRRVEKLVFKRDASNNAAWGANPIERRRFVWNGWLMLRETIETDSAADGTFESTRTKTYTWGRDLAASSQSCGSGLQPVTCLESAGGIGGLLSIYDDNATTTGTDPTADDLNYVYFYDANGNVGQLSNLSAGNASASLVAKYEYDAYGNVAASSGSYATANTYRFSTKPWDDETGFGYWGYRYYEARMGRWLNRDPIGELGGLNEYAGLSNAPAFVVDAAGMRCWRVPTDDETDTPCEDSFCDALAAMPAFASRLGQTVCRNGTPCYCLFARAIRNYAPFSQDILKFCIRYHENAHVNAENARGACSGPNWIWTGPGGGTWGSISRDPGADDECATQRLSLRCVRQNADKCMSSPNPCACFQDLINYTTSRTCAPNPGLSNTCPTSDVNSCLNERRSTLSALYTWTRLMCHGTRLPLGWPY